MSIPDGLMMMLIVVILLTTASMYKVLCEMRDNINYVESSVNSVLLEIRHLTKLYCDDRQSDLDLISKIGPGGRVTSKHANQQKIIEANRKVREEK